MQEVDQKQNCNKPIRRAGVEPFLLPLHKQTRTMRTPWVLGVFVSKDHFHLAEVLHINSTMFQQTSQTHYAPQLQFPELTQPLLYLLTFMSSKFRDSFFLLGRRSIALSGRLKKNKHESWRGRPALHKRQVTGRGSSLLFLHGSHRLWNPL